MQISIIESVQGTRNNLAAGLACEATPANVKGNFIDVIYTSNRDHICDILADIWFRFPCAVLRLFVSPQFVAVDSVLVADSHCWEGELEDEN